MKIVELTNHLSRFYRSLHTMAGRYARLNQTVARYYYHPISRQSRGLAFNVQKIPESHLNISKGPEPPGSWDTPLGNPLPDASSSLPFTAQTHSDPSPWLPQILQKSPILKKAISLPSSAQFNLNQGRFVPFVSQVRSQVQEFKTGSPEVGSDRATRVIPETPQPLTGFPSGTAPSTSTVGQSPQKNQVSITSTARQLLWAAASLPLVPVAFIQSAIASPSANTQVAPNSSSSPRLSSQIQAPPIQTAGAQNTPRMLAKILTLQSHSMSKVPAPVTILRSQALPKSLIGLSQVAASRTFPDLARANRLDLSGLPLPPISSQGVYTPSAAAGTPQNLSQIVTAYAENEAGQAQLNLTSKTAPRTMPTAQLPKLQSTSHQVTRYASANSQASSSAILPRLGDLDPHPNVSLNPQPETLPRLSEWERRNFELDENEDQVSMEELREKIARILSEELRRYLPGE